MKTIEAQIIRAMVEIGWIFPATIEEVEIAEQWAQAASVTLDRTQDVV